MHQPCDISGASPASDALSSDRVWDTGTDPPGAVGGRCRGRKGMELLPIPARPSAAEIRALLWAFQWKRRWRSQSTVQGEHLSCSGVEIQRFNTASSHFLPCDLLPLASWQGLSTISSYPEATKPSPLLQSWTTRFLSWQ